jgi:predicted O-methyltransferase YrrM
MTVDIRREPLVALIQEARPKRILEIGSWQGFSAIAFLEESRSLGIQAEITCVDTWLGSIEHWLDKKPGSEWSLAAMNVKNGEPTFIEDFRKNVREAGFAGQVTTLRAPSEVGLRYLSKLKKSFDLIFIDGDHSYAAVASDLRLSKKLLAKGGTLSGDDWNWPGVRRAVMRFALNEKLRIEIFGRTWKLTRTSEYRDREEWKRIGLTASLVELLKQSLRISKKWKNR